MSLSSLFKGSNSINSQLMSDMTKVVVNAANGNLEGRVTNIPDDDSENSKFAWAINDLLDQTEAFMRDASTSIKSASSGKTYRKADSAGMHGLFSSTADGLNDAIVSIAAGHETQVRGEMANGFSELGGGIAQGLQVIQGDMSIRFHDRYHKRLRSIAADGSPDLKDVDLFRTPATQ